MEGFELGIYIEKTGPSNYENHLKNFGSGYARCKIVYDEMGIPVDCLIVETNVSLTRMINQTIEDVLGKKTSEIAPLEDWKRWIVTFEEVANSGKEIYIQHYSNCLKRWVKLSLFSHHPSYITVLVDDINELKELEINFEEQENLICSLQKTVKEGAIDELVEEITEKKEIEEKLRQSEERYRLLVESSPYGMMVLVDEEIQFANHAAAKLLNLQNHEDLLGRPIINYVALEDQESFRNLISLSSLQKKQEVSKLEIKLISVFDELIDVEAIALAIPYCNNRGVICTLHDIRERKKNEELKQRIEEKDQYLKEALEYDRLRTELFSNISHEFKTPLNVILGTLQLIGLYLKDVPLTPLEMKISKKIKMLKQNCYRLLRLVNNLIDISKIDGGYYEINLENNDIVKTAEVIAESVKEYIENKGIQFEFTSDFEELYTACDTDKIERILLNLLSNSIKFTKPGGKISVTLGRNEEAAIIAVKDTGIGIPMDKIDKIFDRFSQLNESLIRKNEGSGMGLSLVKSLVSLHGGNIQVESEYGVGSEFKIQLPIRLLPEHQVKVEEFVNSFEKRIEKINIEFSDIYFNR